MWDKNEQGDLPSIINHRVRASVKTRWDHYIAQANATGYTELQIAGIHSGGRTHGTFIYDSRDHSGKYVADMKEIGFSGTDDGIDQCSKRARPTRGLSGRLWEARPGRYIWKPALRGAGRAYSFKACRLSKSLRAGLHI